MELLLVSLAGGLLALDATSVGQFMVSRPLVAGALTGWLVGDPALGLAVGALLEVYLIVSFPSGGARFPEGATATVVAVASAAVVDSPGSIPLGVAAGLIWGQVGGITVSGLRQLNGRIVPDPDALRPDRLARAHVLAVTLDGVRGASVTLAGTVTGRWGVTLLADAWPLATSDSRGLLLVGGAVSAGILLRSLGGYRKRRMLFAAGLAMGAVGARFL